MQASFAVLLAGHALADTGRLLALGSCKLCVSIALIRDMSRSELANVSLALGHEVQPCGSQALIGSLLASSSLTSRSNSVPGAARLHGMASTTALPRF